jgi:hypothetical protein
MAYNEARQYPDSNRKHPRPMCHLEIEGAQLLNPKRKNTNKKGQNPARPRTEIYKRKCKYLYSYIVHEF